MAVINLNLDNLITADDKFAQRREAKAKSVEAYGKGLFQEGFAYDFGADYGVLHLQLRNELDRTNWLTARTDCDDLVAAGQGDNPVYAIQTAENVTVTITPNDAIAALKALSAWGGNLYQVTWSKKAAIRATTNDAELDAIIVEDGWV